MNLGEINTKTGEMWLAMDELTLIAGWAYSLVKRCQPFVKDTELSDEIAEILKRYNEGLGRKRKRRV